MGGEIISFILCFLDGVDWVPNSRRSPLDTEVLIATSLSGPKGDDANRVDGNAEEESLGEVEDSVKRVVAREVDKSPKVEGSPETVDPLAGAVSVTMARFGGVSNVVDASFLRRRLWDEDVEGVILVTPCKNER
jgi:hypothetical protein